MKVELVSKGQNWAGEMPFYFNLSQPVGKRQPNTPADVGFVQFCFAALARAQFTKFEQIAIYAQVHVTRVMDDRTQNAIDSFLESRRLPGAFGKPDGILHAVPQGVNTSYAKDTPYAIVMLNWFMLIANSSIWPRLDLSTLAGPIADDLRTAFNSIVTA